MNEHLFKAKPFKHSYLPDGQTNNIAAEVEHYNQIIKENPIDIQLLGIGRNGHIAFNEPGTSFDSTTHEVKLTQSTIEANARFFDNIDDVPKSAICMGIASIMSAKKIVLLAYGEKKRWAIKNMIEAVSYTHLRAHETDSYLVCRLLLEKKKKKNTKKYIP